MEVSHLLSQAPLSRARAPVGDSAAERPSQAQLPSHQYRTRHSTSSSAAAGPAADGYSTPPPNGGGGGGPVTPRPYHVSPQTTSPNPKHVAFELFFPESPSYRARLPMRVQIFPHDTTESIITTVKNFYGLYEGPAGASRVSFQDEQGHTLIARYENFRNGMVVYVRVLLEQSTAASPPPAAPAYFSADQYRLLPPQPAQALTYGRSPSRPDRAAEPRDRTASPLARGRRSVSSASREHAAPARSRPPAKSRASSTHGHGPGPDGDAANGYSDSDGGHGSVTGSRKARSEQLASADISLDNIVEGGRRKRAKFESSELPLFVPPQVPMAASSSSLSPARRTPGQIGPARLAHPPQRAFPFSRPLPSPQSLGQADAGSGHATRPASSYSTPSAAQHGHHLRDRASASYPPAGQHGGGAAAGAAPGILPTPDPTVASCISDEDVAIQLMRLGDASNLSHGTRHSASTLDDGFSGAADAASSTGGSGESDSESDATDDQTLPARPTRPGRESSPVPRPGSAKRRHKHLDDILPSFDSTEPSSDETAPTAADRVDIKREGDGAPAAPRRAFVDELQRAVDADAPESKAAIGASASASARPRGQGPVKGGRVGKPRPLGPLGPHKARPKAGAPSAAKMPISPASLPAHSRKQSAASTINFEHQLAEDEEDLSSKPRCQRCRKSKKGCDRQRPCQRCKDAGIAADGCLSEDEGNGRKGRFGRHMGVVVKKDAREPGQAAEVGAAVAAAGAMLAAGSAGQEKSKKRKR